MREAPKAESEAGGYGRPWPLPSGDWILHTTELLGSVTDRWLDLQAARGARFPSRLLGWHPIADQPRQPHWLIARDRPDLYLAARAMRRTRGLSSAWLGVPLRGNPPAVVHAHYGNLAACQLPLAGRCDAPIVASFYGFDATETRFTDSRRWSRAYRRLFAAAAAVIVEGPRMAERLNALGCPEDKISIIRLPADSVSLARLSPPRVAEAFTAVMAGRFVEKKGFETGIRAFSRAFDGRSDARLVIVGGGPLEPEYREIVASERIGDRVDWAGRLPFERFMETISAADVALYPSRTAANGDSEGGAPVTLVEAQWLGVPSLVSSHDDLPFVAAPEGSVTLAPDDLDSWITALRSLYEDATRRQAMAAASQAFARAKHSIESNTDARESVYAEAVS